MAASAGAALFPARLAALFDALVCPPAAASRQVRGSKFVKYQECKIQESPDEVRQLAGQGQLRLQE